MWDYASLADGGEARMHAAWADLAAEQSAAVAGREPALHLGHTVDAARRLLKITVSAPAGREPLTVDIGWDRVEQAIAEGFGPLRLVASAMTRGQSAFPEIGHSKRPPREEVPLSDPTASRIREFLDAGEDVALVGDRGAHKTGIAASVAYRLEDDGNACVWLDYRDGFDGAGSVAWQVLRLPAGGTILVVVNQLRGGFRSTSPILRLVRQLREDFDLPVRVLVTGRERMFGASLTELFRSFEMVFPEPEPRLAPEGAEREVLHWFACLKLFDIEPSMAVVRRRFERAVVDRLTEGGAPYLVARSRHYTLHHDVDALALISRAEGARPPGDVIWEYLKLIGTDAGSDLLRQMDEGDFPLTSEAAVSSFFSPAWDLLFRLGETLDERSDVDPTWGDNVGAAVFAAEALAELGHREQWSSVAGFVRRRWSYERPGELPAVRGEPTSEAKDFDEIRRCMIVEDGYFSMVRPPMPPCDDINFDEFHRTWMLGVLLGFEGTALDRSPELVDALKRTAAQAIRREGYFYPRRVPWVTARVVLGLCRVGLTDQDDVVRRACDWLKRPVRDGGAYGEWWKGGTGSWNRDEATTAMCVAALIRAGQVNAPEVRRALAWLGARSGEWTKTDREIDLALVLEAILLGAPEWRSSYSRLLNLLHWANRETRRQAADQAEPRFVPEGALRVPFAAAQLAALVRAAVGREADALRGRPAGWQPIRQRSPESATAPSGYVRPLPSEARWRQRAQEIESTLEGRIGQRRAILRRDRRGTASEHREQERIERQQLEQCLRLSEQLADHVPRQVLDDLLTLGRAVCDPGWDDGLSYGGAVPR